MLLLPEKPPTPIRCCRTPEEHDGEQARRRRCSSASSATFSRVHRATELGLEEERRSAAAAENHTSATAAAAGSTGGAGSSRRGINASRWSSFSRADHPVAEDHELGGTALRIPPFFVSASRAACCWGPLSCLSVVLLERSPRPSPSVRAAASREIKKKGKRGENPSASETTARRPRTTRDLTAKTVDDSAPSFVREDALREKTRR